MTPRLLGRVASESGLSEAKVKNGMNGAVASILGGLAGKASDRNAMGRVADIVSSSPDIDFTLSPERVFDDSAPTKASSNALLGLATGDGANLTSKIASTLGIGGKAAGGLVMAAASLALAAFKKLGRATGGLDATRLATTLMDESREINARIPTGMATGAVAHDRIVDTGTTIRDRAYERDYVAREEVERAPSRAWWWVAALIPLALLGYWLYNRSRTETVTAPVATPPAALDTLRDKPVMRNEGGAVPTPSEPRDEPAHPGAMPTAPQAGPADTTVEPALSFPAGSIETRFLEHVKSPAGADDATWFELDQVTFATGSSDLDAASSAQIANIAKILEANPAVTIRVGGYTDATGDAAVNQQLSQDRAEAVAQALVAQGIDASRVDTKGFGEHNKLIETEGREQANRRAAIRVMSR